MSWYSAVFDSLPAYALQTVLLIVLFVIVRWYLRPLIRGKKNRSDDLPPGSACSNPNCVRCSNYYQVIEKARSDFTRIFVQYKSSLVKRLEQALIEDHYTYRNELQQPNVFFMEDLAGEPIWNQDGSPIYPEDMKSLEAKFSVINTELLEVEKLMNDEGSGWRWNITQTGSWATFPLYNQGIRIDKNCEKCPQTTRVVEGLKNGMINNLFGNVYFSIVGSDTVIEEHFGPTNIRLRCHLGLQIPDDCYIEVAGEKLVWKEGSCILFDDSFLHKVFCGKSGPRIVLILDMWHPEITAIEKQVLSDIFSPKELI